MESNIILEDNTWLWIVNTLFYLSLYFLIFVISNAIFKFKYRKKGIDVNSELTVKDNAAFSILTVGYYLGVLIIFLGVIQGHSAGYLEDALIISSYSMIGILLLLLASIFNEKVIFIKKFKFYKEIIRDENKGTGFIEAANFIGSALIIYGAITGTTINFFAELEEIGLFLSGCISLIAFWILGQLLLFLFFKIYAKYSPYNVFKQLEEDNEAVGIVYSSIFISISYLYSQAIKGNLESWELMLENIAYYLVLGLILLPVSRFIIDKIILPKSSLTDEIVHQEIPNKGAAIIEAFAYIGSAILISYCI
ncbi:DUF350 domain-containing protein [Pseudotenacibaculum haliotis]|uniref:DUF350 domain-containing protein n=1 Tax=Pseudotenacibaculum haliotis TaxID=1862138 RepID=A0ABW5LP18_9FLAO